MVSPNPDTGQPFDETIAWIGGSARLDEGALEQILSETARKLYFMCEPCKLIGRGRPRSRPPPASMD